MWRGPTKLPPPPNEALATRGFVQNEKCKHDDNDIKHDCNNVNMMTKTLNMITTTLDMMTTTYKYWILRSSQNMSTNCLHNLSLKKYGNNWWKLSKKKADDHSRGGWLFHQSSRPQNPLCNNHLLVFVSWLFVQLSRLPSFLLQSKIDVDRNILN